VVLPTYNEAASIARFLAELLEVLETLELPFEVIVVDDASPDGTARAVADAFGAREELRLWVRRGERGLAASIRDGLARAKADALVVMDADFNHDPQVLPLLVRLLHDFDLVSGSRFSPGGGMYSRVRYLGSLAMNLFARALLQTQVQDNLSGYYAIRRSALEALPWDAIFHGYGDYYLRLLLHAQRRGLRIVEVPVVYRSREGGGSKTPLLRTGWRYAREILRLRLLG
jgi:dolichol-phosphate mannosyltransferase